MATATSDVEVCDLAFDLLRQKEQVTSLETPESELESLAARWYDVTRRSVLQNFPWNFARKRVTLTRNSTAPAFGYPDAYDLPSDYIEIVFIGDNYDEDYETEYHIENGQILIDNSGATSLNVCYIRDITTVVSFSPLFVDLLVAELSIRFANSLTGVNKSMKELNSWRKELEGRARSKNGQANPPRVRNSSPLSTARRSATRTTQSSGKLFS